MRTFSFTLPGSLKEQGTPAFAERLFAIRDDPADEIIAATSVVHNAPLLTRDRQTLKSPRVPFAGCR
jgi:PIN domain nuclease of toxin-antitoxin system